MTLVAWSKVPEKVSDMKGSESPNTCNLSKKTFGITCLVLGLILIQSLILGSLYTTYTTLEAKDSQLKTNITSLTTNLTSMTDKNLALETKVSDLELQLDKLKVEVRHTSL